MSNSCRAHSLTVPAIQAFMKELKFPANMAFPAYFMIILVLVGANTLNIAISMPIVPKLANPLFNEKYHHLFTFIFVFVLTAQVFDVLTTQSVGSDHYRAVLYHVKYQVR